MPGRAGQNITQEDAVQENTAENSREALKMEASIAEYDPERGVLACVNVKIGDIMTIRNVKIKEDDYGLTVSMPRTKMPHTDQYRDSVFFADKDMKEQFDRIVQKAYQDSVLHPVLDDAGPQEAMEPEETSGMSMGM